MRLCVQCLSDPDSWQTTYFPRIKGLDLSTVSRPFKNGQQDSDGDCIVVGDDVDDSGCSGDAGPGLKSSLSKDLFRTTIIFFPNV